MEQSLVAKIAKVALEVSGKLSADARNTEQRYDYISADKVLNEVGRLLANNGVVIFPKIINTEITTTERSVRDRTITRIDARVEFVFTVTDGNTHDECRWIGYGSDYSSPDKAHYKAVTSGHKYFLMKLLMIGAGNEDGEHESVADEQPASQSQRQSTGRMTVEQARETISAGGVRYGDMPKEQLVRALEGLRRALSNPALTMQERELLETKAEAAAILLKLE